MQAGKEMVRTWEGPCAFSHRPKQAIDIPVPLCDVQSFESIVWTGQEKKMYGVRDSNPPLLLFPVEGSRYTP